MTRRLEVVHMLRGIRDLLRRTRSDISTDHGPEVTSRLWRAEMEVQKAADAAQTSNQRDPSASESSEPPERSEGPLTASENRPSSE